MQLEEHGISNYRPAHPTDRGISHADTDSPKITAVYCYHRQPLTFVWQRGKRGEEARRARD